MKQKEWINPNKMKFESLHKTFNRQCRCISTGNQIGDVVYSNYIRPYNRTVNPVRQTVAPGHLQNYDLTKNLVGIVPTVIADRVRCLGKDKMLILYQLHHWKGEKQIVDGWVLTTGHDDGYRLLFVCYEKPDDKTRSIIDEATKYITN